MKRFTQWLSSTAATLGIGLLILVGLVLFALFAVAARPILMIGFLALAIGAALASAFSPRFQAWFETIGEPQVRYSGLRLATDTAFHPSHSWARLLPGGAVVGADDLMQFALGPVESVELPSIGSRVEQGQPLFALQRGDRRVDVRAPVSGTVVSTNDSLLASPKLVNEEPFTNGWAVRLRPDHAQDDRRNLLQGNQAKGWFRHDIDRLLTTVLTKGAVAPALPDGGELVGDMHEHIDDQAWKTLTETVFAAEARD